MKRAHLYLKAFFSYHYKKNMIIRLLFLSYPVPYKSSYSANGKSMDLRKKIYCLISFLFLFEDILIQGHLSDEANIM